MKKVKAPCVHLHRYYGETEKMSDVNNTNILSAIKGPRPSNAAL
jgi:hypothetical protein